MTDEEKKIAEDKRLKEQVAKDKANEARMAKMEEGISGFGKLLEGISGAVEKLNKAPKPDDKKSKLKDVNLETLDRAGFLGVILDKVGGMLDDKVKPVAKSIQDSDDDATKAALNRQLKKAEKAHPDFWEWKKEIGAIAQRSPGLSVEEMYKLARSSDEKKVTRLDKEFESDEDKQKEVDKKKTADEKKARRDAGVDAFGGLTPTSGKTTEKQDMTLEDAAETAFDKVMGAGDD